MYPIQLSLDQTSHISKPQNVALISNRIGKSLVKINSAKELLSVVEKIGLDGHTFCPATFRDGKRNQENFILQPSVQE